MKEWEIDTIIELLLKSADIAMHYYNQPKQKELKQDRSIVTIADKSIEAVLAEYFDKPETGSYMIGEETVSQKNKEYIIEAVKNIAWIVDPIDGTVLYAKC